MNTFFGEFLARGDVNNNNRVINQINLGTLPRFFGTSASAPNVAAAAALVLQASPGLPPDSLFSLLESTALDMQTAGFDFESGAGLVNVDAAVRSLLPVRRDLSESANDKPTSKRTPKRAPAYKRTLTEGSTILSPNKTEAGERNELMHMIFSQHVDTTIDGDGDSRMRRRTQLGSDEQTDSLFPLEWEGEMILVTISTDSDGAETTLRPALEALDFETTACSRFRCSGFLDIRRFLEVERLPEVLEINPVMRSTSAQFGSGTVFNGASTSLGIDALKATLGLTGSGITIGVMSDSFDNNLDDDFSPRASDDIASGNIPNDVTIVKDTRPASDEGRVMIQLIHDIAPEAKLVFRTAFNGPDDFAAGIRELADPDIGNCDIIVDDISELYRVFYSQLFDCSLTYRMH